MKSLFTSAHIKVRALLSRYSRKQTAAAALVVVVFLGFGIFKVLLSGGASDESAISVRQVQTAPAGRSSQADTIFESTGEVKSQTQGDLRAQSAGIITRVNARVGQRVDAGMIIASIENASERASVAQAQAGVAQAQANLDKVRRGTREEQLAVLAATTASARQSLDEALVSAKNALLGAYTTTGEAFIGGVDALFDDADGANPQLVFTSTNNTQLLTAEHERFLLQGVIDRQTAAAAAVTYYDSAKIREEINTLEGELLKMKSMLDALIVALDGAIVGGSVTSTTISGYKATSNAARTGVLTTLTALSNTRGAINAAETALAVAQENEAQGVSGAQQEDIDVAAAQLASAQATLAQMVAQLEKTRVRAPVTGVVTTLNAEPGDFVTSFQEIGLIANDGALEVQTFVSSAAVGRIVLGGQAVIDGVYPGIVTSIAPGLDPGKRQVEVRVALTGDAPIPHGSRVSVAFRNVSVDTAPNRGPVLVPVSALKLIGDAAFVFTVREDGTLERRGVTLGQVVQSSVEILEGVDQDTIIVLDARGRNAGDLVVVTASD